MMIMSEIEREIEEEYESRDEQRAYEVRQECMIALEKEAADFIQNLDEDEEVRDRVETYLTTCDSGDSTYVEFYDYKVRFAGHENQLARTQNCAGSLEEKFRLEDAGRRAANENIIIDSDNYENYSDEIFSEDFKEYILEKIEEEKNRLSSL